MTEKRYVAGYVDGDVIGEFDLLGDAQNECLSTPNRTFIIDRWAVCGQLKRFEFEAGELVSARPCQA